VKDINGKSLRREHYILLKDLGIEIVMYDLKTFVEKNRNKFGFEVHGSLSDRVDFDELLEFLRIMKIAKETESPAIKDALDQLKLVIGITDESK